MLEQMNERTRGRLTFERDRGRPLSELPYSYSKMAFGSEVAALSVAWSDLQTAYAVLFDIDSAQKPIHDLDATFGSALRATSIFGDSARLLALGVTPDPLIRGGLLDAPATHLNVRQLSTRLLFECASLLDEGPQLVSAAYGATNQVTNLDAVLKRRVMGSYGQPILFAMEQAGRKESLHPDTLLALIDFAINPVIPGMHPDVDYVSWEEFYPPYRFALAARALGDLDEPSIDFAGSDEAEVPPARSDCVDR